MRMDEASNIHHEGKKDTKEEEEEIFFVLCVELFVMC